MKPAQLEQSLNSLDSEALRAMFRALLDHDPKLEVFVLPLLPGGPGSVVTLPDRGAHTESSLAVPPPPGSPAADVAHRSATH